MPSIKLPTIGKSKPTVSPTLDKAKELKVALDNQEPEKPKLPDILLDKEEPLFSKHESLSEKLAGIESILEAEELPVTKLKAGLKDVMTCIKANEDSIMELEPSDIKLVVQGYIRIADQEVAEIVEGKKKKTTKKPSARVTALKKAAQDLDLEEVDF